MSIGGSEMTVVPGGGQQTPSAAIVARTIVQLGVCTKGTPNQIIYGPASPQGIASLAGLGPLVEAAALRARSGLTTFLMPLTQSSPGYVGAVSQAGTGTGTVTPSVAPNSLVEINITTAGALGTMRFTWRVGGVGAFSAPVLSVASGPWSFRMPNTFCTVIFAAGTYVLSSSYTIGVDGTITKAGSAINTVTIAADPIDNFDFVITVVKGGALGTSVIQVSPDGGTSTMPNMAVPSSGVLVIADTGIVLTISGTLAQNDTYSFLACPPGYSTSDLNAAMTALIALRNFQAALIHVVGLPASAAGAYSQVAALETQLETALAAGIDWQGMAECPVVGDTVVVSTAAVADSADTDTVIRTARGADANRVAMMSGTYRMVSPITNYALKRPNGWAAASRFADTDPADSLAAPSPRGPLRIVVVNGSIIGRDENATPGLDDVQINTVLTYRGRNGAFMTITNGGYGWKNLTLTDAYQDAESMRALNVFVAALRVAGLDLLAQRPQANPDGTIEAKKAIAWSNQLTKLGQRAVGLATGGPFTRPQASFASATVLPTSQVGGTPHRLDISYVLQKLGFISDVAGVVAYSGSITVTGG